MECINIIISSCSHKHKQINNLKKQQQHDMHNNNKHSISFYSRSATYTEYFLSTRINNKNDRQPPANTMFNNSTMGMPTTDKNSPFRRE
jgi:hypothetical protein